MHYEFIAINQISQEFFSRKMQFFFGSPCRTHSVLNKMLLEQTQQEQIVEQPLQTPLFFSSKGTTKGDTAIYDLLPLQPPLFFSSKGASKGDPPFMIFYPCNRPCFSFPRALPRAIRLL